MYRVLIVEDEDIVRESIAKTVLSMINISEVLQAKSGYEGIYLSKSQSPHIIITDIKMPGMNGITMLQEIRRFLPKVKCLVLSAYNDFAYARDAINLKVNAYLLKPYEEQELIAKIFQITEELDSQKNVVFHDPSTTETALVMRKRLLHEFVCRNDDVEPILDLLQIYGVSFQQQTYFCVCVKIQNFEQATKAGFEDLSKRYFTSTLGCKEFYCIPINSSAQTALFLCGLDRAQSVKDMLEASVHDYCKYVERTINIRLACGVGQTVDHIQQARESYRQANRALQYVFFDTRDTVAVYSDDLFDFDAYEKYRLNIYFELISLRSKILARLRAEQFKDALEMLDQVPLIIGKHREYGIEATISLYENLALDIRTILMKQFPKTYFQQEQQQKSAILGSICLDELHNSVRDIIYQIFIMPDSAKKAGKSERLVAEMKRIIHEEYKAGLSLAEIADRLRITSGYAGSIFDEYTGQSFNSYLAGVRIEHAKTLLMETNLSLTDIAQAVGINDATYLCTLFRKKVGISPGRYRLNRH